MSFEVLSGFFGVYRVFCRFHKVLSGFVRFGRAPEGCCRVVLGCRVLECQGFRALGF